MPEDASLTRRFPGEGSGKIPATLTVSANSRCEYSFRAFAAKQLPFRARMAVDSRGERSYRDSVAMMMNLRLGKLVPRRPLQAGETRSKHSPREFLARDPREGRPSPFLSHRFPAMTPIARDTNLDAGVPTKWAGRPARRSGTSCVTLAPECRVPPREGRSGPGKAGRAK